MLVEGTVRVELTREQESKVIINVLTEDYYHLAISAHEYEEEKTRRALEDFEVEDYSDMRKALRGIDAVLENYMEPDNYVNWAKAWKKTRALYV